MPTATKLPSGNWRCQVSKVIDGKLVKKSFTDPDKRRAERLGLEWQIEMQEVADEQLTLRKAYERYIESKESILSPGTVRLYRSISKEHLQEIMDLCVQNITTEKIQRAINNCAKKSNPKTVRNIHGLLSAVLKMFRPEFTLNTTLPQKRPTELHIPDDNEIKRLMAAIKGDDIEIPVLLAAFGPMRRGEICALTSNDIEGNIVSVTKSVTRNKDGKTVVKTPKTSSSYRKIQYPDFVIEKLRGIKGNITNISPEHITRRFKRLLKRNGIPEFRFHDLRHYNVSILHAMNIPDKYIMARGGWRTNYTMNNVYNHTLKSKQTEYDNIAFKHFDDIYTQK